jgi:hypothetical protein
MKVLTLCSVMFVWVVRYSNIVEEFKHYQYPNWLRDSVGILKMTCVVLMISSDDTLVTVGASGIALLMIAALGTHFKVKNPPQKMVPALILLLLSSYILFATSNSI